MQTHTTIGGSYRLRKLYKWLNFELPGIVLFGISFFYSIALMVLLIAALLFTPYLLYVLFREKRYGWMAAFGLCVAVPAVISYYLFGASFGVGYQFLAGSQIFAGGKILAGYIPLAFFFCYCFILKLSIPAMLDE